MIELPYCEGIQVGGDLSASPFENGSELPLLIWQVVMATDTQQSPMLQTEANQQGTGT